MDQLTVDQLALCKRLVDILHCSGEEAMHKLSCHSWDLNLALRADLRVKNYHPHHYTQQHITDLCIIHKANDWKPFYGAAAVYVPFLQCVLWYGGLYLQNKRDVAASNRMFTLNSATSTPALVHIEGCRPSKRVKHSAVVADETDIYFYGGVGEPEGWLGLSKLNVSTMQFHDITNSLGDVPPYITASHSCVVYQGSLYFYGGVYADIHSNAQIINGDVWRYHIVSNRWTKLSSVSCPAARYDHSCCFMMDSLYGPSMLVYGGCDAGRIPLNDVWIFSFTDSYWSPVTLYPRQLQPEPRYAHACVSLSEESMMIAGGCGRNRFFSNIYTFNLSRKEWTLLDPIGHSVPPASHMLLAPLTASCFDQPCDRLVLMGGLQSNGRSLSTCYIINLEPHASPSAPHAARLEPYQSVPLDAYRTHASRSSTPDVKLPPAEGTTASLHHPHLDSLRQSISYSSTSAASAASARSSARSSPTLSPRASGLLTPRSTLGGSIDYPTPSISRLSSYDSPRHSPRTAGSAPFRYDAQVLAKFDQVQNQFNDIGTLQQVRTRSVQQLRSNTNSYQRTRTTRYETRVHLSTPRSYSSAPPLQ